MQVHARRICIAGISFIGMDVRVHMSLHEDTRATPNPCIYLSFRSHADIHFKRNCSGLSLFRKSPGCGRSVDKRTAIPGVVNPRPVALGGSHKLNTNWHIARRIRCISRVQLSSRWPLCLNGGTYARRYKFTDKYARQLVNASRVPPLILRTLPPAMRPLVSPAIWINTYLFTGPLPAGFHWTDDRTILINSIFCCGPWCLVITRTIAEDVRIGIVSLNVIPVWSD